MQHLFIINLLTFTQSGKLFDQKLLLMGIFASFVIVIYPKLRIKLLNIPWHQSAENSIPCKLC